MNNEYHFITQWLVEGTVEEVSEIIGDAGSLVRWWPSVYLDVKIIESREPYGYTIEAWGDFNGRGIWAFEQNGLKVEINYDWRIKVNKLLLRTLSFLLKPVFSANHRWAMARGEESLKLELMRRRASSPHEAAQIPHPPGPTFPHNTNFTKLIHKYKEKV